MHTQSHALHNGCDCSECGCCGNFFVCVVPRSCTLHGNEKHSHAKVKAEERPTVEHTRPTFPPAPPRRMFRQFAVCSNMYADGADEQAVGKERKPWLTSVQEDFRNGTSKFHFATPTSAETSKRPDSAASVDSYRRARPPFSGYIYRLLGLISLDESISFAVRKMSPDVHLVIWWSTIFTFKVSFLFWRNLYFSIFHVELWI